MDRAAYAKIKKRAMILWCVVGCSAVVVIIFTLLSVTGIIDIDFGAVTGIVIPLFAAIGAWGQVRLYFKENRITYERAVDGQQDEVMAIIRAACEDMRAQGIDQWDEEYPDISDIIQDIGEDGLYIVRLGGKPVAVYTINKREDSAYKFGTFKDGSGKHIVLHRLCVHPEYQHMGLAATILKHIEETLKKDGVSSVRLDVFTKNPRALALYNNAGYTYAGDAYFRKGKFALMEKIL